MLFGWFKKEINKDKSTKVEEAIQEVKKEEVVVPKNPNHFPDCNCNKCERWRQYAKQK